MRVELTSSPKHDKKFRVTFDDGDSVDFGAKGYSNYTKHGDAARMRSYVRRHGGEIPSKLEKTMDTRRIQTEMLTVDSSSTEDWSRSGIRTAGFWSRWLLWSKPTLEQAKRYITRRFGIRFKLNDNDLRATIARLRRTHGRVYAPLKYFRGLATARDVETRYKKMLKSDFKPFETNASVKTGRKSSYTSRFKKKFPGVGGNLGDIARATGIPRSTLQTVYDRGLAAWRTGHRPGASPQAWAYARVYSYVLRGKTYRTANANLHRKTNK